MEKHMKDDIMTQERSSSPLSSMWQILRPETAIPAANNNRAQNEIMKQISLYRLMKKAEVVRANSK
jgi:hypothetical protein